MAAATTAASAAAAAIFADFIVDFASAAAAAFIAFIVATASAAAAVAFIVATASAAAAATAAVGRASVRGWLWDGTLASFAVAGIGDGVSEPLAKIRLHASGLLLASEVFDPLVMNALLGHHVFHHTGHNLHTMVDALKLRDIQGCRGGVCRRRGRCFGGMPAVDGWPRDRPSGDGRFMTGANDCRG